MKIGYVYKITSPTNRIYIGSTSNIKKRWANYKCGDCKSQRKLYNSFKKYGVNNHKFEIIWEGNIDEMLKQELILGMKFNVLGPNNLTCKLPKLGDSYTFISEETRLKMSRSHKRRYEIMSEEKRSELGWQRKGTKLSEEVINNRTAKVQKTVIQLNLNNDFIQEWESATQASKTLKLSSSDICQCCKNKKKTCGGYKWKYLNEDFQNSNYKPRTIKGNTPNKNTKAVIQMDLKGNFIRDWKYIRQACKELNIEGFHISSCCRGKRKSAYGFKWKYKLSNNEDIS
jgi:group I intron endonuclease